MKKILIVSTFLPPCSGGAEQAAWYLARNLSEKFEVHILTTTKNHLTVPAETIRFHYVPFMKHLSFFYNTILFPKIYALVQKWKFDIHNIHIAMPWGEVFRKLPGKNIITCHGSDVYEVGSVMGYVVKRVLREAAAVVSDSKWLAEYIKQKYDIEAAAIPNGVDALRFNTVYAEPKSSNTILFVGRYHELKGIPYLLQAASQFPEYRFEFAGSGAMSNQITGANVYNLGFVPETAKYMQRATLCVFPSLRESFPLIGLEAMACGTAVIATKLGFSEYIEHGKDGWLINPRSVDEIVTAIKILMTNHDLRRTIEINAVKKAADFSWEKMTDKYIEIFDAAYKRRNGN